MPRTSRRPSLLTPTDNHRDRDDAGPTSVTISYKAGGFIGWIYYGSGCVQIVNPMSPCPTPGDNRMGGSQDSQWNAPGVGLSAEIMLAERWRASTDVAYLPWTDFSGRDHHLAR
ncbi:hypothetical protein ABIF31_003573 [Bradyrhizobium elkanii]